MIGGAKGRWSVRKREPLKLANGPTPEVVPQTAGPPTVYLSHTVVHSKPLEEEFLRCSGVRYRCFSFVYVVPEAIYWSERALAAYEVNVAKGNHLMMDSGAFSFQMFLVRRKDVKEIGKLREKTIEQYVQFCKKKEKDWDWYVTFDYDQKVEVVWQVTKQLEARGLKPVPVYHGDQSLDWLRRYLDAGYKRVGISSLTWRRSDYRKTRRYLDQVFRVAEPYRVKLHGFAVTSLSLTFAYPWASVDSSSWSRTASYGAIYALDLQKGSMAAVHVSLTGGLQKETKSVTELSMGALKSVQEQVERAGWDFELLRRSLAYRFCYNGWVFAHLDQWKSYMQDRHVKWGSLL